MRTKFLPLWLAAMLALNLGPGVAGAEDAFSRCRLPIAREISTLMQSVPDAVVYEFRGSNALIGIRIFNALPPTGHEVGDRFYIAMRPYFPLSRLMVVQHGCVTNAMLVDLRVANAIRKAIKRLDVTWAAL